MKKIISVLLSIILILGICSATVFASEVVANPTNSKITVNGAEVKVTVDEHGIVTIPCAKDDVVEIDFTTETTSINSVVASNVKNGTIYDISGRRVEGAPVGQVYIQDGVKRLNK